MPPFIYYNFKSHKAGIGVGPSRDFFCSVGLRLSERSPKNEVPLWVEEDIGHAHAAFVALTTGLHPFPIDAQRVADVALRMSQGWIASAAEVAGAPPLSPPLSTAVAAAEAATAAMDATAPPVPGAAPSPCDGESDLIAVDVERVDRRFRLFGRLCGKALQDGHILAVAPSMPFLALVCGEIAPVVARGDDAQHHVGANDGAGDCAGDDLWLQLPQAIPPEAKHGVSIAVLWFIAISLARIERSFAGENGEEQRATLSASTLAATIARVCSSNAELRVAISNALPRWVFAPTMTVALFLETYSERYGFDDPFSGHALLVPCARTSEPIIVASGAAKKRAGALGAHGSASRKRPRVAVRSMDSEDSESDDISCSESCSDSCSDFAAERGNSVFPLTAKEVQVQLRCQITVTFRANPSHNFDSLPLPSLTTAHIERCHRLRRRRRCRRRRRMRRRRRDGLNWPSAAARPRAWEVVAPRRGCAPSRCFPHRSLGDL